MPSYWFFLHIHWSLYIFWSQHDKVMHEDVQNTVAVYRVLTWVSAFSRHAFFAPAILVLKRSWRLYLAHTFAWRMHHTEDTWYIYIQKRRKAQQYISIYSYTWKGESGNEQKTDYSKCKWAKRWVIILQLMFAVHFKSSFISFSLTHTSSIEIFMDARFLTTISKWATKSSWQKS